MVLCASRHFQVSSGDDPDDFAAAPTTATSYLFSLSASFFLGDILHSDVDISLGSRWPGKRPNNRFFGAFMRCRDLQSERAKGVSPVAESEFKTKLRIQSRGKSLGPVPLKRYYLQAHSFCLQRVSGKVLGQQGLMSPTASGKPVRCAQVQRLAERVVEIT